MDYELLHTDYSMENVEFFGSEQHKPHHRAKPVPKVSLVLDDLIDLQMSDFMNGGERLWN